jgi:tRNA (guanine37-N1)-methyltransferase
MAAKSERQTGEGPGTKTGKKSQAKKLKEQMIVDILSLFPEYFHSPLDESMMKHARKRGVVDVRCVNIRDFSEEKHKRVDDRPYGGGPGMVMMAEPVAKAIRSVKKEGAKVIYLSPQGKTLTAAFAKELALSTHLILLCGHYEGIDQRVIDAEVDEEISIGNYVLTNGCLAALVLLDAIARFVPGFLGDSESALQDSFESGLLDCPHYTRPEVFEENAVPSVLLSGDHRKIAAWRRQAALKKTFLARPDLLK